VKATLFRVFRVQAVEAFDCGVTAVYFKNRLILPKDVSIYTAADHKFEEFQSC
jgi:hypothetical protein